MASAPERPPRLPLCAGLVLVMKKVVGGPLIVAQPASTAAAMPPANRTRELVLIFMGCSFCCWGSVAVIMGRALAGDVRGIPTLALISRHAWGAAAAGLISIKCHR